MTAERLFESFYGFDRVWPDRSELIQVKIADLSRDYFNNNYQSLLIHKSSLDNIKGKLLAEMLYSYIPPIDGYTDQDYLDWIEKNWVKHNSAFNYDSWRYLKIDKESKIENDKFKYIVKNFFSSPSYYSSKSDYTRNDKVFRLIELNEFFERAKPEETLKEFLQNDSLIHDLCKSFTFNDYGKNSNDLIFSGYGDYQFMDFGKLFPVKARKLILELNKEELSKVILRRQTNPLKDTPISKTSSFTFIKDFIDHALGKAKVIERKTLSDKEIKKAFTLKVIGDLDFWGQHSKSEDSLNDVIIRALFCINDTFRRDKDSKEFLSYIINSGALKGYNPRQTLAIFVGGCITGHWISKTTGKDIRQVAMEKIDNNELELSDLLDFISYIICADRDAVSGAKFDWDLLQLDTASEWIYSMFATVKTRESTVHIFKEI